MTAQIIEKNPIVKLTLEFSLQVNEYCPRLYEMKHWDLGRQLFRSATSIGANVWEAQNGESKADFIHKMKIAAKEANETQYWLTICDRSTGYPDCKEILKLLESVQKLLSSIIATSKRKDQ